MELRETRLRPIFGPLTRRAAELIGEGLRRGKRIDCFDFVPSNYDVVHAALAGLRRGRFCEWGSGIGIVTGLAEILGFESHGVEIDERLAAASRELLADFGLSATIETGDYAESIYRADLYFTYCWPGDMRSAEEHFYRTAPRHARLLICHGAEDVRLKSRRS